MIFNTVRYKTRQTPILSVAETAKKRKTLDTYLNKDQI